MTVATWVVGATGQLGSALLRRLTDRPETVIVSQPIRWAESGASGDDLAAGLDRWLGVPGATSYRLYWAAGASITSTTPAELDRELEVFTAFADRLNGALLVNGRGERTTVFLASSAGGVYSGSKHPPFDERTEPHAISPYGAMKLAMERIVTDLAEETGARAVLGRISTLYGPGQRIDKPQGFVSHLCKSFLTRQPMTIYVSLDTMRDYIYADDAAEVILAAMARVIRGAFAGQAITKNIASHVPTTLGHVLHESRLVFKRRPDIILTASDMSRGQIRDLRVESTTWPELNDIPRRSLLVGLAQTRASMELSSHAGTRGSTG